MLINHCILRESTLPGLVHLFRSRVLNAHHGPHFSNVMQCPPAQTARKRQLSTVSPPRASLRGRHMWPDRSAACSSSVSPQCGPGPWHAGITCATSDNVRLAEKTSFPFLLCYRPFRATCCYSCLQRTSREHHGALGRPLLCSSPCRIPSCGWTSGAGVGFASPTTTR